MPNLHLTTNLNQVNSSHTSLPNDWPNMSELPTMLSSIQLEKQKNPDRALVKYTIQTTYTRKQWHSNIMQENVNYI